MSLASSVSLGDRVVTLCMSSEAIGPSTPPQSSSTGTPASLAMAATLAFTSSGISL